MIVGVVGNPEYSGLRELLARLVQAGPRHNFTFQTEPDLAALWPTPAAPLDLDAPPKFLICFGGDGTLLRAARLVGNRQIPILGVKIGRVGFLANATPERLDETLKAIVAGDYTVDGRRTLEAYITGGTRTTPRATLVLNDVVVHKAGVARVIRLRVVQDEEEIGAFSSDGLIVATPTGSTAYSLSAGGPIVVPGVDALVITAISPHTLAVRPIVVPGESRITIEVLSPRDEEVLVSYDGQVGEPLHEGERVIVTRSAYETRLIRVGTEGFFARMRVKLQWGDLTDRERD